MSGSQFVRKSSNMAWARSLFRFSRDKPLMLSLILPNGGVALRRGKPQHMSLLDLVNRIPFTPNYPIIMDEQAYNIKILVDQDIAMAWIPYVFYSDEKLRHTGTNIFTLLKQEHDGKWMISVKIKIVDIFTAVAFSRDVHSAPSNTAQNAGLCHR